MTSNTKLNSECLQKAADDEPIFVLRGQDALAPALVREWARRFVETNPEESSSVVKKYRNAMACADEMERYPLRRPSD
jgi:hypothetical protein